MFWNKKEGESGLPDLPEKEDSSLEKGPELPPLPSNSQDEDLAPLKNNSLPSFPDSPFNKGLSQTAIKEAINQESEHAIIGETKDEGKFKAIEMDSSLGQNEITPSIVQKMKKLPEPQKQTTEIHETTPIAFEITPEKEKVKPVRQQVVQKTPPPPQKPEPTPVRTPSPEAQEEQFERKQIRIEPKSQNVFVKIEKYFSAKKALSDTKGQLDHIEDLLKKIREIRMREEQELESWEKELLNAKSRIQEVNENVFEKGE